jgi:hypothetical protein
LRCSSSLSASIGGIKADKTEYRGLDALARRMIGAETGSTVNSLLSLLLAVLVVGLAVARVVAIAPRGEAREKAEDWDFEES